MAPTTTKMEPADLGFFAPTEEIVEEPSVSVDHPAPAPELPTPVPPTPKSKGKAPPPPPPNKAQELAKQRHELSAPTLLEIESDPITKLAEKHWAKEGGPTAFDPAVVTKIWENHLVRSDFNLRKVMLLEFSQYLEKVRH